MMVSSDHTVTAVAGAYQRALQGARPGVPDLRRMDPSLTNAYSSDDGPCPALPPAELWRHPKLQLLQCRHTSAGGRAGQADRIRRLTNTSWSTADPSVADPACPDGLPEEPSDELRPQLLWSELTILRGMWKQTAHFVIFKNE